LTKSLNLGALVIDGKLRIDGDDIELKSVYIWVRSGELEAGTK